jgi:hypothetical protein
VQVGAAGMRLDVVMVLLEKGNELKKNTTSM